jgi:hypothetical protein
MNRPDPSIALAITALVWAAVLVVIVVLAVGR